MSAPGLSYHFTCAQQSGRFETNADIKWRAGPAGSVANDPSPTSLLRQPGQAHALIDTLAFGEVSRIAARSTALEATDREPWVKCKSRLGGSPRLIQTAEQRQGSGKVEMREGKIAVGLDAAAQPGDRFGVRVKLLLCDASNHHPSVGKDIAWREAQRFVNVEGLCAWQ
jgi:hypothetical protein